MADYAISFFLSMESDRPEFIQDIRQEPNLLIKTNLQNMV